jgi:hypothetical protein
MVNDKTRPQNQNSPIFMALVPIVVPKHIILQMSTQEFDKAKEHFDHLHKCPRCIRSHRTIPNFKVPKIEGTLP